MTTDSASAEPGLRSLLAWLAGVEGRVRQAVARRRATDPHPDDPYRGLYLTDDLVDALLAAAREPYGQAGAEPAGLLPAAGLTPLDEELLLVALAPDVDSRFEQLYAYLNDDVTRRRATVGLALRLCGLPEGAPAGRSRLAAGAPLVDLGLVAVEDPERPLLSRPLRVPDRVTAHLLGDGTVDPVLAALVTTLEPVAGLPGVDRLARMLSGGETLVHVREHPAVVVRRWRWRHWPLLGGRRCTWTPAGCPASLIR